jgi:hypothetical protein
VSYFLTVVLSMDMLNVVMLSVSLSNCCSECNNVETGVLSVIMLSIVMLSVTYSYYYSESNNCKLEYRV